MSEDVTVNPTYVAALDDGTGDEVKVGYVDTGHVVLEVHNEAMSDYFGVLLSTAEAQQICVALATAVSRAERLK